MPSSFVATQEPSKSGLCRPHLVGVALGSALPPSTSRTTELRKLARAASQAREARRGGQARGV